MGRGTWDSGAWASTRATYNATHATTDSIYTRKATQGVDKALDPVEIAVRESRDSDANPNSTALILGLDVTGSMDPVLDHLARHALGALVGEIYTRKPITDPHIMLLGIGDMECDRVPFQATQFEAENDPLIAQLEKIILERGGGGNAHESYAAAWYFAATRTSIDCFEKRGTRGYLFTVGDEGPTPTLYKKHLQQFLGGEVAGDVKGRDAMEVAQSMWNVFHVIVEEGNHYMRHGDQVRGQWLDLLGQHAIPLSDHRKLAEVIVSAIQVAEGADKDDVVKSWSGDTSLVVHRAIHDIARGTNAGGLRLNY